MNIYIFTISTFNLRSVKIKIIKPSQIVEQIKTQYSYEEILKGNGFGLDEAYGSINTVSTIRNLVPIGLKGEFHPFCKKITK